MINCKKNPKDLADYRYQGLTTVPSDIPSRVKRVFLQQNSIRYIRAGDLSHLSLCRELNLGYNKLREITKDMLEGLYSLEELDLSYNQITVVNPGSFANLPELEVLGLAGNELTTFEENVFRTGSNRVWHPDQLELALDGNPLQCDGRMCWVQRGEQDGWVHFEYKYDWVPQCVNYPNIPWKQINLC